jgi:hypothetical protein
VSGVSEFIYIITQKGIIMIPSKILTMDISAYGNMLEKSKKTIDELLDIQLELTKDINYYLDIVIQLRNMSEVTRNIIKNKSHSLRTT